MKLLWERFVGELARHSHVCRIENRGCAISVYSVGVPCTGRFTAAVKIALPLATFQVLKFVSIESYLKAISSDYGSNKEYLITEETLGKCGRKG